MKLRLLSHIFLLVLLQVMAPSLPAQELLDIDTRHRCVYTGEFMETELYRFSDYEQATAWVQEIADLGGAELNFDLIFSNVENVSAVRDSARRVLLYSLDFLEKSAPLEIYGALAHAVGHHAFGHTFDEARRQTEELEADQFMGYVLAKKGFVMPQIEAFLQKMPSSHGVPIPERRKAVLDGFEKSERALKLASLPFDDDPALDGLTIPSFPWPPPACFNRTEMPKNTFAGAKTLGDVDRTLCTLLDRRGYRERSYFSVPRGFAMVTQLEQYNGENAGVRDDKTRWLSYPARERFSGVLDYITAFFSPQKGYFRLFVFIATDQPFNSSNRRVSKEQATEWLNQGFNKLPAKITAETLTAGHSVIALVYEFEVPEVNGKPTQKCPAPHFDARTHLKKAGLF